MLWGEWCGKGLRDGLEGAMGVEKVAAGQPLDVTEGRLG